MLKILFQSLLKNWKENLYLLSLATFLVALPTSVAFIAGTTIALLVVWIITGNFKEKWNRLIHNKNALLLMSIPLLYVIGLFFTQNLHLGLRELNKSLHWFIFAFILGSSAPLSQKTTFRLLSLYIAAVILAAIASFVTIVLSDINPFVSFRSFTWIDHIPFSYQISFSIWLLIYFLLKKSFTNIRKILLVILIAFLITTLLLLKSFNGYIYFGAMTITALIMLLVNVKERKHKLIFSICLFFILSLPTYYIYQCFQKFYDINEYSTDSIENHTLQGNLYHHDFKDKTKENGNYVSLFICEEELIPLWNTHSVKPYDYKTSGGYPLSCVIIRYMTSKGLTKDAQGFAQLSQKDIENIESEIPNYIFADNRFSVYPRIYETIWELDLYLITSNPNNKSFSQRIEQARLAFPIINKHPWLGIGLGNNANAFDKVILETGSQLIHQETGTTHNQYLNYLIRFGILGFLYIIGVVIWVFCRNRKSNLFIITIFLISMLVANFGEANFETFIGLIFFNFFLCFFMWIAPKDFFENLNMGRGIDKVGNHLS